MSDPPKLRVDGEPKIGHRDVMTGTRSDQQTGQTEAMPRTPSDHQFGQMDANRRESGVFLSPQNSRDDSTHGLCPDATRVQLDSGYRSGQSESSVISHDPSPRIARFFVPDHTDDPDDCSETILLASDDHHEQNDLCSDDDEVDDCDVSNSRSAPVNIPAASIHEAHCRMLRLMEATPPRTYLQHGSPQDTYHGRHRYSTGCLSLSPVVISALRQCQDSQTADCFRQGLRVTSGRLHASNSRASLAQRRKSDAPPPPLELIDESNHLSHTAPRDISPRVPRISRDRSQSAPDISSVIVQHQCAQELRRISDDFFADFHGKKPTSQNKPRSAVDRTQSQSVDEHSLRSAVPTLPSSFPGTGQTHHSSTWWQTVVQSIAPSHIRRPSSGTSSQH